MAAVSASRNTPNRNICGVRARQSRSRSSVASISYCCPACFTVSRTGRARIPPTGWSLSPSMRLSISVNVIQGRAASWTSTQSLSAASPARRFRPFSTEWQRSRPPGAVTTRGWRAGATAGQNSSPSATTTTIPLISGCSQNGSTLCSRTVRSSNLRYCLGRSAPMRRPIPPAGMTAQKSGWPVTARQPVLPAASLALTPGLTGPGCR